MSHRFEYEDQQRRDRARAHLARIRDRRAARRVVWRRRAAAAPPPRPRLGARPFAAVLLLSMAWGVAQGQEGLLFARDLLARDSARLDRIAVQGAHRLSADRVARATGVAPGTPIAELDAARIAKTLAAHAWIERAGAARLPIGALLVSVDERVAQATTLAGQPARAFAVDASGTVFAPAEARERALPRLVTAAPSQPGARDPALASAVELSASIAAFGLGAPREIGVSADARGYSLRLPGLDTEFVLGHEALPERLHRLSRLLAARPAEVAAAARVDLRFEDQVVLSEEAAREGSPRDATARGDAVSQETRRAG